MDPACTKKFELVVMTSAPGPMLSAMRQASKASEPEETPTACEHLQYCAIALSHSSTLGPRMKCCDCNTSARAVSISDLIARYCALRLSSGTFIFGFFFESAISFAAFGQVRR